MSKIKYFLTIEYLGTHYHGWQTQKQGERTLQETIQNVLGAIFQKPIGVTASGRTDAGVHAEGQVAHVTLPDRLPPERVMAAMNGLLPWDIRARSVSRVTMDSHARKDTLDKTYRYQLYTGPVLSPFLALTWQHYPATLSQDLLERCADCIAGENDFCSFTTHAHLYRTTIRYMLETRVRVSENDVIFSFRGNGFMRHMIRRIVGGMVEVARGKKSFSWFHDLVHHPIPSSAAPTAPARGLILESVRYPLSCYNP